MSASVLFSIGTRAMTASYAALQTTGNNIANANTAGYSRQQVELATAAGQFTGGGFFGRGVDVSTVSRVHDEFLTREAALTQSVAEADGARLSQLQRLEKLFGTGEAGLGYLSGQLLNSFVDVASRPQDAASRQVALGLAADTAARFRATGEQIDNLQAGVAQDLQSSVQAVNALAQTVAALNVQIVLAKATGHEPNDLLDQRDSAVAEIGKVVQVTAIEADDGAQNLFIGGGQRLVLGAQASSLSIMADPFDPARAHVGVRDSGFDLLVPDAMITGGSMAGLLRFQNEDLRDARNLIGQMAAALAGALNAQQHLGLDLTTPAGSPGQDLLAVGAPRVLPASTNGGTAVLDVQTADASQLQASDYELRFDGSNYTLTRLGSQEAPLTFTPAALAAGVTVDGMKIGLASGAATAGDRFLLQPVAGAASGMRRVLEDPRGIAAASPVTATLGSANSGTLTIRSLDVRSPIAAPANAIVKFNVDPVTAASTYQISVDGGSTFAPGPAARAGPGDLAGRRIGPHAVGVDAQRDPRRWRHGPGRPDRVPGGQQRQCAGAGRAARCDARRRQHGHRRLGGRAVRHRRARAERRRCGEPVELGGERRAGAAECECRGQPRRRSRPPDPVPAELPGRSEDAAGGADPVRHAAAGHGPLDTTSLTLTAFAAPA